MIEPRRETMMQESPEASGIPDRREHRSITHPQWRDGVACMPLRRHWRRLFRSTSLHGATRRFRRGQRGSVAIESALGITVLVVSLALVMQIVSAAYASDQMSRAARAAARSIALNPPADQTAAQDTACNAIIRELHLAPGYICNAEWTINIDTDLVPKDLPVTLDPGSGTVAGTGDMVFVRIGWERDALTPGDPAVPMVAMGLARSEP